MIPVSKATNAYELLEEVAVLILEEPKRYNQQEYLIKENDLPDFLMDIWPSEEYLEEKVPQGFPECGTVGCRAGWVFTLLYPTEFVLHSGDSVYEIAKEVLGIDSVQAGLLFGAFVVQGAPQTKEHAEDGARGIREFMQMFEQQLRLTPIVRKVER